MEQKQPEVDETIQFKPILNPDHTFSGKWITIKGTQQTITESAPTNIDMNQFIGQKKIDPSIFAKKKI